MLRKPSRVIDERYLDYVRTLPCLLCQGIPSEAHHIQSRGAGGSDRGTVPLCRRHHQQVHRQGKTKVAEQYGNIDWWFHAWNVLHSWALKEAGCGKSTCGVNERDQETT